MAISKSLPSQLEEKLNVLRKRVCDTLDISGELLVSSSRKSELVAARKVFIRLAMETVKVARVASEGEVVITGPAWVELGNYLNRDHSTIMYNYEEVADEDLKRFNPKLFKLYSLALSAVDKPKPTIDLVAHKLNDIYEYSSQPAVNKFDMREKLSELVEELI